MRVATTTINRINLYFDVVAFGSEHLYSSRNGS